MLKIRPAVTGLLEDKVNISFVSFRRWFARPQYHMGPMSRGGLQAEQPALSTVPRGGAPGAARTQGPLIDAALTQDSLTTSADQTTSTPTKRFGHRLREFEGEEALYLRREVEAWGPWAPVPPDHREFSRGCPGVQPEAPEAWEGRRPEATASPGPWGPAVPRAQRRRWARHCVGPCPPPGASHLFCPHGSLSSSLGGGSLPL